MNKALKLFFSLCLFSFFTRSLQPISEKNVKWWALGVGGITTAVIGGVSYYVANGRIIGPVSAKRIAVSGILGLGAGSLAGWAAYAIAKSCTPRARYLKAEKNIILILNDPLVNKVFNSENEFVRHVLGAGSFGRDWPLVLACDYFDKFWVILRESSDLLSKARAEAIQTTELQWIVKGIDELVISVQRLFDLIADRKGAIMSHPAYDRQYDRYQKFIIEEAKRREKKSDRYAKVMMHNQKMRQRDKDRKAAARRHDKNREAMSDFANNGNAKINIGFKADC